MKKICLVLLFLGVLVPCCSPMYYMRGCSPTYYMRADGTAANKDEATGPSTDASKCMSITTHNSQTFSAGDTIIMADDGGTYRGRMTVPSGGSFGSPITYRAEFGDSPVISAALIVSGWTSEGDNVYSKSGTFDPIRLAIWTKNGNVTKLQLNDGATSSVGLNEWDWVYTGVPPGLGILYINVGEDPANGVVECGRVEHAFEANDKGYIRLDGLRFEGGRNQSIHLEHCDYWEMDNVEVYYSGWCGLVAETCTNSTIDGGSYCENYNDGIYFKDYSTYITVKNATVSDNGWGWDGDRDGIGFGGNCGKNKYTVVDNCVINDNHGIATGGYLSSYLQVKNCTMEGNGWGRDDAPTVAFSYCQNVSVTKNLIKDANRGIRMHKSKDLFAAYNVIRDAHYGIVKNDYPGLTFHDTGTMTILNNTIYDCAVGIYVHHAIDAGTISLFNNIIYATGLTDTCVSVGPTDLVTADYNLYYTSQGSSGSLIKWGDTTYTMDQWSTYKSASGQDANSPTPADPLFVNIGNDDFDINPGSPARDAGGQEIADDSGASWEPAFHGLSSASDQSFLRVEGVDLSAYVNYPDKDVQVRLTDSGSRDLVAWLGDEDVVAGNLVTNGEIEAEYPWTTISNWNVSYGTFTPDRGMKHGGQGFSGGKFTRNSQLTAGNVFNNTTPVTEGKLYYVEAWIYNDSCSLIELKENLTTAVSSYEVIDSTVDQDKWVKLSGYVTAVSNMANAIIMVSVTGSEGQVAYMDNVVVREVPLALTNGDMESGDPPSNWSVYYGTSDRESGTVYGGSYSLKFTRNNQLTYGSVLNNSRSTESGKLYYVEAWVYNDDMSRIDLMEEISSDGGYALLDSTTTQDEWIKLSGYATSAANDTNTVILVKCWGSEGQIVYLDDIVLDEITDAGIDGTELVTARGGTTNGTTSIESGFDLNDASYDLTVKWAPEYDFTGSTGVTNSSGTPLSGGQIDIGAYEY